MNQGTLILPPTLIPPKTYSVWGMPAGFSGCAFWRYRLPIKKLNALGSNGIDFVLSENPDKTLRLAEIESCARNADIVSLQSPGHDDAHSLMVLYKTKGKKLVVDYDDYSFDVAPGNPRYADLGIKEQDLYDDKGNLVMRWRDGENGFDLKANLAKFHSFVRCVKTADMVTTTTDYLANKFRSYNPNVVVLPNSVDMDLWRPLKRPEAYKGQVRIGWFGGDSHYGDLRLFARVLPAIIAKYPQVKIVMQSARVPEWQEFFKDIPPERLEWHDWADLAHYTVFLASRHIDIGLCPLEDTEFNRCKSSIKQLEMGAFGVPSVCQTMLPYAATVEHGKNGFLAGTDPEWVEAISMLVEDADRRRQMGQEAYKLVEEHFNLDKNCRLWEKAYLALAER